jgi:hypothetical protein
MNAEDQETLHFFQKSQFVLGTETQKQAGNALRKVLSIVDAEIQANAVRKVGEVTIAGLSPFSRFGNNEINWCIFRTRGAAGSNPGKVIGAL